MELAIILGIAVAIVIAVAAKAKTQTPPSPPSSTQTIPPAPIIAPAIGYYWSWQGTEKGWQQVKQATGEMSVLVKNPVTGQQTWIFPADVDAYKAGGWQVVSGGG